MVAFDSCAVDDEVELLCRRFITMKFNKYPDIGLFDPRCVMVGMMVGSREMSVFMLSSLVYFGPTPNKLHHWSQRTTSFHLTNAFQPTIANFILWRAAQPLRPDIQDGVRNHSFAKD